MMAQGLIDAFPDLHFECVRVSPVGYDEAVVEWVMYGTNTGSLHGLPPTYQSISLPGIDVINVRDGQIQALRGYFDRQDFSEQLGLDVITQPKEMGPVTFGTSLHLRAQTSPQPGALSLTWIDLRPEDNIAEFNAYGQGVLMETSQMEGHHGTWLISAGNREVSISAWSDVEAVKQIHQSKAHQTAMRAFFDSFGSASGDQCMG